MGTGSVSSREVPALGTVVVKVKLTTASLTLYESLFYSANAKGHTHSHTLTHPVACRGAGLVGNTVSVVVAMGNREKCAGGGG